MPRLVPGQSLEEMTISVPVLSTIVKFGPLKNIFEEKSN